MIRKVFYDYLMNYNNTAFKTILTDGLNNAICQILETLSLSLDEGKFERIKFKTEERMRSQKTKYFELVREIKLNFNRILYACLIDG